MKDKWGQSRDEAVRSFVEQGIINVILEINLQLFGNKQPSNEANLLKKPGSGGTLGVKEFVEGLMNVPVLK